MPKYSVKLISKSSAVLKAIKRDLLINWRACSHVFQAVATSKGVFQVLTFAHHTLPEVLSFQSVNFCLKSNLQNNFDIIFRSFLAKVPKQTLTILRSAN